MANPRRRTFPTGAFWTVVALVCVGLAASALYSYSILTRLRTDYLRNRGQEIASGIDAQMRPGLRGNPEMRGPGLRINPEAWGKLMEETLEGAGDDIAFISLLDQGNQPLVTKGEIVSEKLVSRQGGFTSFDGKGIYIYEYAVVNPRQGQGAGQFAMGHRMPGRLQVGLFTSAADRLERAAVLQLALVGVAVLALLALSYYFLRTLDRFLNLEAKQESERHLRYLGGMAATLAHEIRNPLGAMKGLTQLAQEDLPGEHSAQALMNTVVSEAERLERLVTDLLTFARPPKPQFSSFDFALLMRDVRSMLKTKLDAAGISLEIAAEGAPLTVNSDESGLRQVLLNVFFNAMDVTPRGGAATVLARRDGDGRTLLVDIDDSGPGLGDRDPEELFQPFMTTKTQGTGLGLAVSRKIIEGLGGSLTLANRPEGGARCRLSIPTDMGAQ